jgi:DNA-binding NarL/FixJ family response regulator
MTGPIRIGLADDDSLARMALANILHSAPDIEVAWAASDGQQALEAARDDPVDVILMDVQMPGTDGLTACRMLQAQGTPTRVVMLTTFDTAENISEALSAGASGFLTKDEVALFAPDAVRAAARGAAVFSPAATIQIRDRIAAEPAPPAPAPPAPSPLTEQERRIAVLVAEALTNREIARRLGISESTTKTHVSAIITKLGCADRVGIVIWVFRQGLVA